jgi:hypothetical protein
VRELVFSEGVEDSLPADDDHGGPVDDLASGTDGVLELVAYSTIEEVERALVRRVRR